MVRVRVITPIISAGFRNDEPLRQTMPTDCELSSVFLKAGPASVESAVDEVLAAPGVVDAAIEAEADGIEAVVIDCMLDPGLDAAREAVNIPVIGAGEAGINAAAAAGPFSIVTVLDRQARAFRELAARYSIADRLVSVRGIGISVLGLEQDRQCSIDATIRACAAASEDGARAVVFGCTGMLGFAEPVTQPLGDKLDAVIDPLPYAVERALAAARAGQATDKTLYPAPEVKRVTGFDGWVALSRKMRGEE